MLFFVVMVAGDDIDLLHRTFAVHFITVYSITVFYYCVPCCDRLIRICKVLLKNMTQIRKNIKTGQEKSRKDMT